METGFRKLFILEIWLKVCNHPLELCDYVTSINIRLLFSLWFCSSNRRISCYIFPRGGSLVLSPGWFLCEWQTELSHWALFSVVRCSLQLFPTPKGLSRNSNGTLVGCCNQSRITPWESSVCWSDACIFNGTWVLFIPLFTRFVPVAPLCSCRLTCRKSQALESLSSSTILLIICATLSHHCLKSRVPHIHNENNKH